MGTRGCIGIRIDGKDKLSYNHSDSYFEGLGVNFVNDVQTLIAAYPIGKIKDMARSMVLVGDIPPTEDQIQKLSEYCDLGVSEKSTNDWYCLTRKLQGDLLRMLSIGIMLGNNKFIHDSLFCEFAYILNLDSEEVEFYVGFQKEHHSGRYWAPNKEDDGYYGCLPLAIFPMRQIPEDWMRQLIYLHKIKD